MTRRRLFLAAVVLAVPALAGVGLVAYALRAGAVNRTNFDRIQVGMPLGRVERLMGDSGYFWALPVSGNGDLAQGADSEAGERFFVARRDAQPVDEMLQA